MQTMDTFQVRQPNVNLPVRMVLATCAGLVACFAGAVLWGAVTVFTGYELGIIAIALGLMVGGVIAFVKKSDHIYFGIIGALLALIACVLGKYFGMIGLIAQEYSVGYFNCMQNLTTDMVVSLFKETFSPIDLLFYGLAIYEGFRLSMVSSLVQETPEVPSVDASEDPSMA